MIKYDIIGAVWRSEFYIRIAMLMTQTFSVSGIFIRNPEKHKGFSKNNIIIFEALQIDCF